MNSPESSANDIPDFLMSVVSPALLASALIAALFYLGGYSVGDEFLTKTPQINRTFVADSATH